MPFMREKASSSELRGLMNDSSPMLSNSEDDGEDGYHHALPMHTKDDGADDPISSSTRGTMSCCSCGASSDLSSSRRSRDGLSSSSSSTRTGLHVFIIFFGLIAGLAVLFQYTKEPTWSFHSKSSSSGLNRVAQWGPAPGKDVQGVEEIFLGNQRVAQRILIRGKTDREGLGSQLNHIKGSMILAKALEATFILGDSYSHHHYSTSDMINGPIYRDSITARPPVYVPLGQTCALSDHLPYEKRQEVIRGWCLGNKNDQRPMQRIGYSLAKRNCSIIIDDVSGRDFYNDLNQCYTDVLRERLGGIDDRRNTRPDGSGDAGALTVGIHVRWGDTSGSDNATEFRGSMPTASVNEIIHEAQKRFKRLDIRIAMESHNDHVLEGFEFDYTLVDSGDVMADLHALADNDLLLIGSSSFAILVHMMAAPDGVTILDGNDRARKFPGTQRTFFGTFEAGFDPSMLDSLPQRFPEVELV
ncbi:BZ3500_MvSof-1268-A1-R1_Chr3-3g06488 [Microbotryum saponariae]|uniref:BZ3500_MvSof-1268-A1-R1_Chr3-3g06488 protein n=1 Tax=Microbotryum saponariae TaxID=289078 RepID=A0A2X0M5J4_9BASI|nr:BZ3500_MvSof-1268-A1-R1_Chr3-3g06488 [Microbotryum saponariae]SDA04455.1 BZ3501_MvSof-1269-A2-R1_Chr3-2g06175 [Microbotryum saponariae]